MNGILLIDKPADISSGGVIYRMRAALKAQGLTTKIGHTGTLDPFATGMLPLCLGRTTRLSQYLLAADKCYQATIMLGVTTNTGDSTGDIISEQDAHHITQHDIARILPTFIGDIQQTPPMHSAIKHAGKPLYWYARRTETAPQPIRTARTVRIHDIRITDYQPPNLTLRIHASKGTYIRTLAEDIGNALGVGAHAMHLHRVWSSPFQNHPMHRLDALTAIIRKGGALPLLASTLALTGYPQYSLTEAEANALFHGQKITPEKPITKATQPITTLVLMHNGALFGVGEYAADSTTLAIRYRYAMEL